MARPLPALSASGMAGDPRDTSRGSSGAQLEACDARARHTGCEQHLALPEFYSADLAGFVGSVNTALPYGLKYSKARI